jgi:hypothetical protein
MTDAQRDALAAYESRARETGATIAHHMDGPVLVIEETDDETHETLTYRSQSDGWTFLD